MKKAKIVIYTLFLVLALYSCARSGNIKEYIEKGFAKPSIEGDAHFTVHSVGDGGNLYVPSEQDIEVQFTISNKYSKELTGMLDVPQDKKALFNKPPEIKELSPTKMLISFNFKDVAEPSRSNSFMGESVGMTVKIFEKKTGRFLATQNLTTGCNTPPLPIKEGNIRYKEESDEYIVILPKGSGKHKDLKHVKFTLSGAHSGEVAESHTVSIEEVEEQGKECRLKIKGNKSWQLKKPSMQRKITAIVYDKAGLRSPEGAKSAERYFTSITLQPDNRLVSYNDVKDNGVSIPKIKELEEFFNGADWESGSGYEVKYESDSFKYENGKLLVKRQDIAVGEYRVKVTLMQGNSGYAPSANYIIKIIGSDKAELNKDKLVITDITEYSGKPSLVFDSSEIIFTESLDGKLSYATIDVPYTSFDTAIRIDVEAISDKCIGEDANGISWGAGVYQRRYEKTLLKRNASIDFEFSIISEDENDKKKYKITFRRSEGANVTIAFNNELLPTSSKVSAKILWTYGEESLVFNAAQSNDSKIITVTKGDDKILVFELALGSDVRVKQCTSTNTEHSLSSLVGSGGGITSLKTNEDFILTITLRPLSTVKWQNYLEPSNCGYTHGKVTYGDASDEKSYTPNISDAGHPIIKGHPVKFKVEMSSTERYKVSHWKVNGELISQSKADNSITLDEDKTLLTIKSAKEGDYVVSVETRKLTGITIKYETMPLADSGKVEITRAGISLSTLDVSVNKAELSECDQISIKISELDPKDKIISYRLNYREVTELPSGATTERLLKEDGFWSVECNALDFKPGDVFEIVVARVKHLNLSVRDESDILYNDNDYKLTISQTEADKAVEGHVLLPKKDVIEITHQKLSGFAEGYYPIYITQDTLLDFKMTNLKNDKEIKNWKYSNGELLAQEFNEEADNPQLIIGNTIIENYKWPINDYETHDIVVEIRDATSILTIPRLDFENNQPFSDANIKVVIYEKKGSNDKNEIYTFEGDKTHTQIRIAKNKKIQIEAIREATSHYYFAEWGLPQSITTNNYSNIVEYNGLQDDTTLNSLWTKTLIIKMHRIMNVDKNKNNFPRQIFGTNLNNAKFGSVGIKVFKVGANDQASEAIVKHNIEEAKPLSVPIVEIAKGGYNIALQFYKDEEMASDKFNMIKKVFWKYVFGGNPDSSLLMSESSNGTGKPSYSPSNGLLLTLQEPQACGILHLWLYKVKK